jgi:hypothetical protein
MANALPSFLVSFPSSLLGTEQEVLPINHHTKLMFHHAISCITL